MNKLITLALTHNELKNKNIEVCKSFLESLSTLPYVSNFKKILGIKPETISLEITNIDNQEVLLITCNLNIENFVRNQLNNLYPDIVVSKIDDPIQNKDLYIQSFKLKNSSYYPLLTYDRFIGETPVQKIKQIISKTSSNEITFFQIVLSPIDPSWQTKGLSLADFGSKNKSDIYSPNKDKDLIIDKVSYPAFYSSIRIASTTKETLSQIFEIIKNTKRTNSNELIFDTNDVVNLQNHLLDRDTSRDNTLNINEILTLWNI